MNTAKADTVQNRASAWFLRLQSPDVTNDELDAFGEWLMQSPVHEAEYFALEELWQELDNVVDDADIRARRRRLSRLREKRSPWSRRGVVFAAAASLILALGAGLFYFRVAKSDSRDYSTALGEQRVVALEDGSVITLDTLTSLTVRYLARQRRIELHNGQAHFQVEKDRARPFVVVAGPGVVRALGTRFDVYKAKRKITVTLLEGAVEVQPLDNKQRQGKTKGAIQSAVLQPGERLIYNLRAEMIAPVSNVDIKRASAWRNRRLDFENTPLNEVVTEVNRYSSTKLELGDRDLETLTVSGVFEVDYTEDLVKALRIHFNVRAVHGGARRIVLMPSEGG